MFHHLRNLVQALFNRKLADGEMPTVSIECLMAGGITLQCEATLGSIGHIYYDDFTDYIEKLS